MTETYFGTKFPLKTEMLSCNVTAFCHKHKEYQRNLNQLKKIDLLYYLKSINSFFPEVQVLMLMSSLKPVKKPHDLG